MRGHKIVGKAQTQAALKRLTFAEVPITIGDKAWWEVLTGEEFTQYQQRRQLSMSGLLPHHKGKDAL